MLMSKKKKAGREWTTPLEESKKEAVRFANGLAISLNVLKLLKQLDELEENGVTVTKEYRESLILQLSAGLPVADA
tara:strand:+ start:133 stop:360 length:228 start_codon:yes stop_codon:yes gene_type:complete